MSFRSAAYVAAVLSTAPLGLLAAQQAAAPTATTERVPTTGATGAADSPAGVNPAPAPAVPQPQYSPLFQKSDPAPALGANDNTAVSEGKSHTIVLSTLALILVVVILVLLIA